MKVCHRSCFAITIAIVHITRAEALLSITSSFPVLSALPSILPVIAKQKNQAQDTAMQASANSCFSVPLYRRELVPITPTVSIIA